VPALLASIIRAANSSIPPPGAQRFATARSLYVRIGEGYPIDMEVFLA
jgi:hypothetical protein